MQVWQNVLQLWEYRTVDCILNGRKTRRLQPLRRRFVDRSAAAAVFLHFGFDKYGYLPYEVFIQSLNESPARLLGHELLLDKTVSGKNGIENMVDVAYLLGDAKVDYPKCTTSVFPPSGFDEQLAKRSMTLPRAHMWLEHVYGYAGALLTHTVPFAMPADQKVRWGRRLAGYSNLANNLFYTHNTTGTFNEVVYYAGMLGVVATWVDGDMDVGMRQRFFFGHDNDIQCLTIHPNRRFVATGQQTATFGRPYTCIWDIGEYTEDDWRRLGSQDVIQMRNVGNAREPIQLQKLVLPKKFRSILAVGFSGNRHAAHGPGQSDHRGGELLATISGDNQHTVHIWRWMLPAEQKGTAKDKLVLAHQQAMYIPSWHFGPEKRLPEIHRSNKYFILEKGDGPKRFVPGQTMLWLCISRIHPRKGMMMLPG